jgi:hypothetical protein
VLIAAGRWSALRGGALQPGQRAVTGSTHARA